MSESAAEATVALSSSHDRYEITTDDELAGFTEFVDRDGRRIFYHTEIGEEFGGRGLGRQLIDRALSDTRAAELRIVPVCPFVKKHLQRHHEFDDLVDAVTQDAIAAVRERTR
ncbi:GNAT family N-acetyltransferase [Saccharopolyspora griseoalba]|uniref:GNAT family N-acetyltransferase n=1 Tax=Saccharopolyspora griseoalba TaxID=1431848 RepID=A0ABW2LP32_9PSEU